MDEGVETQIPERQELKDGEPIEERVLGEREIQAPLKASFVKQLAERWEGNVYAKSFMNPLRPEIHALNWDPILQIFPKNNEKGFAKRLLTNVTQAAKHIDRTKPYRGNGDAEKAIKELTEEINRGILEENFLRKTKKAIQRVESVIGRRESASYTRHKPVSPDKAKSIIREIDKFVQLAKAQTEQGRESPALDTDKIQSRPLTFFRKTAESCFNENGTRKEKWENFFHPFAKNFVDENLQRIPAFEQAVAEILIERTQQEPQQLIAEIIALCDAWLTSIPDGADDGKRFSPLKNILLQAMYRAEQQNYQLGNLFHSFSRMFQSLENSHSIEPGILRDAKNSLNADSISDPQNRKDFASFLHLCLNISNSHGLLGSQSKVSDVIAKLSEPLREELGDLPSQDFLDRINNSPFLRTVAESALIKQEGG